jgi:protein-tyrosine phosphatase
MSRSAFYRTAQWLAETTLGRAPLRRLLERRATRALQARGNLVFVCFGNIARSPFAEQVARRALSSGMVSSAGTFPQPGRRSTDHALAAAASFGIDLAAHRSRVLTRADVRAADTIFVFDLRNWWSVVRLVPTSLGRIHFVGALNRVGPLVIDDPHGGARDEFERTYARIDSALAGAP